MKTTSRAEPHDAMGSPEAPGRPAALGARRGVDSYLAADFPWYGLDEAFTGPRWLTRVGVAAEGPVEHGSTGHGDEPTLMGELGQDEQRFVIVVTIATRPVRRSADGTGVLDATTASSAAWLAGSGLLSRTWPAQMERSLRQDWLEQQTSLAWELAEDLGHEPWSRLTLPVDGTPADFRYRESEHGWVLAGTADGEVCVGAYGRGMSAYGLGFAMIRNIETYAR